MIASGLCFWGRSMSYQELFEKLDAGAWVLTANSRMARFLIKSYLDLKRSELKVCLSPRVLSLKDFCLRQYDKLSGWSGWSGWSGLAGLEGRPCKILTSFEACLIWQKIIIKNLITRYIN